MAADQAQFQQLLVSLLSTDNDVRQQAEVSLCVTFYSFVRWSRAGRGICMSYIWTSDFAMRNLQICANSTHFEFRLSAALPYIR